MEIKTNCATQGKTANDNPQMVIKARVDAQLKVLKNFFLGFLPTKSCCCLVIKLCRFFMTPWTRACHTILSSTASWSLVKFMLVASVTLSNHLVLCRPLLALPSHFPNIRVYSRESSLLMRRPKYWSLSFRICPSSEHSGLIDG